MQKRQYSTWNIVVFYFFVLSSTSSAASWLAFHLSELLFAVPAHFPVVPDNIIVIVELLSGENQPCCNQDSSYDKQDCERSDPHRGDRLLLGVCLLLYLALVVKNISVHNRTGCHNVRFSDLTPRIGVGKRSHHVLADVIIRDLRCRIVKVCRLRKDDIGTRIDVHKRLLLFKAPTSTASESVYLVSLSAILNNWKLSNA